MYNAAVKYFCTSIYPCIHLIYIHLIDLLQISSLISPLLACVICCDFDKIIRLNISFSFFHLLLCIISRYLFNVRVSPVYIYYFASFFLQIKQIVLHFRFFLIITILCFSKKAIKFNVYHSFFVFPTLSYNSHYSNKNKS